MASVSDMAKCADMERLLGENEQRGEERGKNEDDEGREGRTRMMSGERKEKD